MENAAISIGFTDTFVPSIHVVTRDRKRGFLSPLRLRKIFQYFFAAHTEGVFFYDAENIICVFIVRVTRGRGEKYVQKKNLTCEKPSGRRMNPPRRIFVVRVFLRTKNLYWILYAR